LVETNNEISRAEINIILFLIMVTCLKFNRFDAAKIMEIIQSAKTYGKIYFYELVM
jgi:hypothetical protein